MQQLTVAFESHLERRSRPPSEWLRQRAAGHARASCRAEPGTLLPAFAVNAFESHIRRAVMQWSHPERADTAAADDDDGRASDAGEAEAREWQRALEASVVAALPAMRAHGAAFDVQRYGCRLLSLCARFGWCSKVVDEGGVGAAVAALAAHPKRVHNEALGAISSIAHGEGEAVLDALTATHAVRLAPASAAADAADAFGAAPLREAVNALAAVQRTMREHGAEAITQRYGMLILARVGTALGAGGLRAVRASGGLQTAATTLHRHAGDASVAEAACALLHGIALAAEEPGRRCGALEVQLHPAALSGLSSALRHHTVRSEVQFHAASALRLIAASSDRARSEVMGIPGTRSALVAAARACPEAIDGLDLGRGAPAHDELGRALPPPLAGDAPSPRAPSGGGGGGEAAGGGGAVEAAGRRGGGGERGQRRRC